MRNTGEGAKPPLRYSLNLSAHFRVWVTVWVRRFAHILTHTIFGVFATKKHRKPKSSMLFGAAGQIRTADLILTKRRRAFQPLQYKAFQRFFVQKGRGRSLFVPLFPSAHFPVWVTVWVKPPRHIKIFSSDSTQRRRIQPESKLQTSRILRRCSQ